MLRNKGRIPEEFPESAMAYGDLRYRKGHEILDPAFEKYQSQISQLQQNKPMSGQIGSANQHLAKHSWSPGQTQQLLGTGQAIKPHRPTYLQDPMDAHHQQFYQTQAYSHHNTLQAQQLIQQKMRSF